MTSKLSPLAERILNVLIENHCRSVKGDELLSSFVRECGATTLRAVAEVIKESHILFTTADYLISIADEWHHINDAPDLRRWGSISRPIPVDERMPDPHTKVVAHYLNSLGEPRTIFAEWVPAKSRTEDGFYWEEGWYEIIDNWGEAVLVTEGQVTHWQYPPPSPHREDNSLPISEVSNQ